MWIRHRRARAKAAEQVTAHLGSAAGAAVTGP
jgi:hypothetical protein